MIGDIMEKWVGKVRMSKKWRKGPRRVSGIDKCRHLRDVRRVLNRGWVLSPDESEAAVESLKKNNPALYHKLRLAWERDKQKLFSAKSELAKIYCRFCRRGEFKDSEIAYIEGLK